MELTAILIDDEQKSRETLDAMLKRYCKNVKIIGTAENVETGLALLKEVTPDILFLDIQMPDGTGFNLLQKLDKREFDVIFTTAYDQFAIKAIKFSALDYLLKPIDPEELIDAVDKVINNQKEKKKNLDVLLENVEDGKEPEKIVLSTSEGMHIIEIQNIIRCQADDYYTLFFLNDGKKIMVSKTLKESEKLLDSSSFIRPHKSHLVNTTYIKTYVKSDGGYLILSDKTQIPVARRKKDVVMNVLQDL
jgi:two-component system LytT family response regulator